MKAPSFTIVRNPWDRLRSCYVDKIVTKKFHPTRNFPSGKNLPKKILLEEDAKPIMSFIDFVRHVERYPDANPHWQPNSRCCLTASSDGGSDGDGDGGDGNYVFHYDYIIKLEDGLFEQLGKLFELYNVPFPSTNNKNDNNGNSNNKKNGPQLKIQNQNSKTTSSSSSSREEELFNFYKTAVAAAADKEENNMSLSDLVERVEKIYKFDVQAHGYKFPFL